MEEEFNGLRAILIDPFKEKIRVAYPPLDDYMSEIKKWMEVSCIDIVTLDDSNMMIIDDNGLLKNPNRYFHWVPNNYNYAGRAVIVGYNEDGETTNSTYQPIRVEDELVKWVAEGHVEEPFMQFIPIDPLGV